MSITVEKVLTEAMELPPVLRAFVAEALLESLDVADSSSLSPKWRTEIQRRCQEVDDGYVRLRDAGDVFAKAYSSLR